MLCEKCEKMACSSRNEALALSAKVGIGGRHAVNGDWYPGETPQALEDWCKKNCKPAKPAKPAKPVEEKIIEPATEEVKMVGSNKKWLNKNEKKD